MEFKKLTNEEIDTFNEYQLSGLFHPYTCINDGDDIHIKYEFEKEHAGEDYDEYIKKEKENGINYPHMSFTETKLIATENGLICPVCNYKQEFYHNKK